METLPKNLVDNANYEKAKFVVVDYNSQDNLISYLSQEMTGLIESGRVTVYSYPEAKRFQMAHAKNLAHRLGLLEGGEVLCNLDADNFTGPHFAEYIAEKFTAVNGVFLWANRNQPSHLRFPKGCNGRIVVSADAFLNSGGYDETKYNSWGPDDKDFHFRLRRFGYLANEIDRQYLNVILHNDKMRFKEYKHVLEEMVKEEFQQVDEVATIANFGRFGQGTVYRNFDYSRPIEVGAMPTRIFGIGMHKTGTTSLHHALQLLGFDSAHWKSVAWAKKIWEEVKANGKSSTLEKNYALSDLPIPMLYRELDQAYPGSKFILTLRPEQDWLRSVENHWSSSNSFKDTWKKEQGFARFIHRKLYGQEDFNETVFLERYRRHNAEVLEYFKDRPNDLLIMNLAPDPVTSRPAAGWPELCRFLRRPIPKTEYPKSYAGQIPSAPIDFELKGQFTESVESSECLLPVIAGSPDPDPAPEPVWPWAGCLAAVILLLVLVYDAVMFLLRR